MAESKFRRWSRVVVTSVLMSAGSYSVALADAATKTVGPELAETPGLGNAYFFGFGGGLLMFVVLRVLAMRKENAAGKAK